MTQESIQPFLQWISAHPTWAGFAVFLISLSESLAIIGLFVPGVVMMTAIGAMIGAGILPPWTTLGWAVLGAIAGDGISYWLGHHYHQHLRDFWPFKSYPALLARGETFFKSHGGKSIILGRFIGPVRPMIPVIAGMMDMSPNRFLFFNITSAIAWAPLYSLPGILIGASLGQLSPEVASRAGLFLLVFLFLLWILYTFILKMVVWILKPVITRFRGHTTLMLGILAFCAFSAFAIITYNVIYSNGLTYWNEPVYQMFRSLYNDNLIDVTAIFTGLGDYRVIFPVVGVIGLAFLWQRKIIAMLFWFGTIGLIVSIGQILKHMINSPRPEGLIYLSEEASFPSGHVLLATATFGCIAVILQKILSTRTANHPGNPSYAHIPWLIAIPLILLISLSRLYLGVHWFTDIMGSLMLATAVLSLAVLLYRLYERHPLSLEATLNTLLIPGIITLSISGTFYGFYSYPKVRGDLDRQWPTYVLQASDWWKGKELNNIAYRDGAFKRHATIFDIQWLSAWSPIEAFLTQQGWKSVPKLSFISGAEMLARQPAAVSIPVMPKFHRDRLPVLTMAKTLENNDRLLLQLWKSDYSTAEGTFLWVGTLRLESAKHPIPMLTVYKESEFKNGNIVDVLAAELKEPMIRSQFRFKIIPSILSDVRNILLIEALNN